MPRLQPVGIKKLTNICIVRLKRNGKRFEVAAYRNTVVAWRNKVEKNIDEVLQVHTIFENVEKGILAKSEDMLDAFGTDDEDKVCVEVLDRGEFQMSEEERQMMVDALFRDVASRVTDMCVNPETRLPYPLSTIERAMRETLHFAPATNKSAKMQALQVIRQLEVANVVPIARARMQLRLLVPPSASETQAQWEPPLTQCEGSLRAPHAQQLPLPNLNAPLLAQILEHAGPDPPTTRSPTGPDAAACASADGADAPSLPQDEASIGAYRSLAVGAADKLAAVAFEPASASVLPLDPSGLSEESDDMARKRRARELREHKAQKNQKK